MLYFLFKGLGWLISVLVWFLFATGFSCLYLCLALDCSVRVCGSECCLGCMMVAKIDCGVCGLLLDGFSRFKGLVCLFVACWF